MIKVLIVDDQRLMCDGIKTILETDSELTVVGAAYTGAEALALATERRPDLVLLDIRMPEMDGVETVLRLKRESVSIRVIMLTTFDDEEYIWRSMANGADGYLLKDMDAAELLHAIRDAMQGKLVMPASVAESLKRRFSKIEQRKNAQERLVRQGMTNREVEIAGLLADGFSNSQIAGALFLSDGTVRNYISAIYEKLGASDKRCAVSLLKEIGL